MLSLPSALNESSADGNGVNIRMFLAPKSLQSFNDMKDFPALVDRLIRILFCLSSIFLALSIMSFWYFLGINGNLHRRSL